MISMRHATGCFWWIVNGFIGGLLLLTLLVLMDKEVFKVELLNTSDICDLAGASERLIEKFDP